MKKRQWTGMLAFLVFALSSAWAQSDSQPSSGTEQQPAAPPAAFGQEPAPPQVSPFPPLSGLDEASLEPNVAARSFLQPGFQVLEAADSNAVNGLNKGGTSFSSVTHLLGAVGLQRLWSRYQMSLDYVGGGVLYSLRDNAQVHTLDLDSRILWRTGVLQFRDGFSYLPEGSFGGAFGGAAGLGSGMGGVGNGLGEGTQGNRFNFFGAGVLGSLGTAPHYTNLSMVDMQQTLSPRAAFTLAGGYDLVHFLGDKSGIPLIDSRMVTAQAGYDYALDRRNKLAVVYGYQHFLFPTIGGGTFDSHVVQFLYGHQISGRMDLVLGGGPQLTSLNSSLRGSFLRISGSGRFSLRYRFPRTSVSLNYQRYDSAASGFFAGAETDLAHVTLMRPLGRRWEISGHAGYAHVKRLQQVGNAGVNANSYQYGYTGLRLNRILSRSLHGFVFYQYNDMIFDSSFCGTAGPCSRTSTRQIAGIGLTWHPHPFRLD